MKYGDVILLILLLFLDLFSNCAWARTEYITIEKNTDVRIFSQYLDNFNFTESGRDNLKNIKLNDVAWDEFYKSYVKNNDSFFIDRINNLYYSDNDYVVLENKASNFKIIFYPEIHQKSTIWTCKSLKLDAENSAFSYFSMPCFSWKKEVFYKNDLRNNKKP